MSLGDDPRFYLEIDAINRMIPCIPPQGDVDVRHVSFLSFSNDEKFGPREALFMFDVISRSQIFNDY